MTATAARTATNTAESRARADARARLLAPVNAIAEESRRLLDHARAVTADETILDDLARVEHRAGDLLHAVNGLLHGAVSGEESERGEMLRSKLRHDLRNHLNVIQGYARLLLDTADAQAESLRPGVETLLSLVEDTRARLEAVLDLGLYGTAPAEHVRQDVTRLDQAVTDLATAAASPGKLPAGRVLVVDDDQATRAILCRALDGDGHTLMVAGTAEEALAALNSEPGPDLVLLDLVLPDGSGLDVLAGAGGVPVIVVSGQDDHNSLEAAVGAGAENVVRKPFDGRLVRLMVGAALRRAAAEAETRKLQAEARALRDKAAADKTELERLSFVLAHDLQEPARELIIHAQALTRGLAPHMGMDERNHAEYAMHGARRLRGLVEGMHAFLRVEQDLRPFHTVALDKALEEAFVALPRVAEDTKRRPLPAVHGDHRALVRLFRILLDNAGKFGHPERAARIGVTGWRHGSRAHVLVADNGIGMSRDEAAPIFDLFRTVHGPGAYPGCGAGLAVARRIVQAHDGTIGVRSRPGHGSVFHVTLPAA